MKKDEFQKSLQAILKQYGERYSAVADELTRKIFAYMDKGMTITAAYAKARKEVDFYKLNAEAMEDAVYESALKGYGITAPPVMASVKGSAILRHKLMDVPWTADNVKLSKRLHGVDNVLRNNILSTVGTAIRTHKTIQQLSMELYDGYNIPDNVLHQAELPAYLGKIKKLLTKLYSGDRDAARQSDLYKAVTHDIRKLKTPALRAAYKDAAEAAVQDKKSALARARKMLDTGASKDDVNSMLLAEREQAVKKALWVAAQEKTRYYANRIARTENARSYYEAQLAAAKDNPDIFGFKWVMSSAHVHSDTDCDCAMYANLDIGYGKGVYPKDKVPFLPAHPHCMCHLKIVYVWDVVRTDGKDTLPPQRKSVNRVEDAVRTMHQMSKPEESAWPNSKGKITKEQYRDLRKFAEERNIKLSHFRDFDGDVELVKTMIAQLEKIADEYPLPAKFRENLTLSVMQLSSEDYALTEKHIIYLNKLILRDRIYLENDYIAQTGTLFPKGTNYKNIIIHEYGHVLDYAYQMRPLDIVEQITGYSRKDARFFTFLAQNVSGYASKNVKGHEITSEILNMVKGDEPSDFALQYMKKYSKIIKNKGGD